jgi:isoleucyl-tRNA synthetase
MRFLHGNLHGWCDSEMIEYGAMPPLEQWILHHLKALDHDWQGLQNTLDFSEFYQKLHTFCSSMLSSFYFDIRKDTLYCESSHSPKRRAARTVLRHVYDALLRWLAPLLCFTAEELYLLDHENGSVHLLDTPPLPAAWGNASLAEHGETLLKLRACVLQSLEQARKKGDIKANLEADVTLELSPDDRKIADHFDFTDIALVSRIHYIENEMIAAPLVSISKSSKEKCLRCWRHDDLTPADHSTPHLCDRCASVIQGAS